MKRWAKDRAVTLLRFVPLIVCVFLIAAYFLTGQDITAESILNYAPAKSLSIFSHDRIEHLRALFRRRVLIILLLLLQIAFLLFVLIEGNRLSAAIYWGLTLFSLLEVLSIIPKREKGAYKLLWVVQILIFPIFGG